MNKQFELCKIDTKLNTADLLTKLLAVEFAEQHLKRMGFEVFSGRSSQNWCMVYSVLKRTSAESPPPRRGDSGHVSS